MLFTRFRRTGTHTAVTLAMAGLMISGPVQAVELPEAQLPAVERIESLAATVEALDEAVAVASREEREESVTYHSVGQGEASYYGHELAGNRTASGERFNPNAMTAAHRTLPLGTKLRVTNLSNGRSVVVRINDRGPFVGRRLIDVSLGAAREIGMIRTGKAQVRLEAIRTA
jgi:rare lipoprotein A (peptidoglycan hydrolase)